MITALTLVGHQAIGAFQTDPSGSHTLCIPLLVFFKQSSADC